MKTWDSILISPNTPVIDAIKVIDNSNPLLTALVIDEDRRLLGTVTDGDIRRGILKKVPMDAPVSLVMHIKPITLSVCDTPKHISSVLRKNKRCNVFPILDENSRLVAIKQGNTQIKKTMLNPVFIMAGGLGTRLRPLTNNCPKPMLPVGDKPILEIILNNFIENGFSNFYFSINYKGEIIEDYFGDGSNFGVSINYVKEKKRLGTAGSLSLLDAPPEHPIIIMNGDLLTKVNFHQLIDYHQKSKASATICVREHEFQLPFGVAEIDNYRLTGLKEKPVNKMFVNAGIYVINPDTLKYIPHNDFFDMPDLFSLLLEKGDKPSVFPVREYWLDIGQVSEYEKADQIYTELFQKEVCAC